MLKAAPQLLCLLTIAASLASAAFAQDPAAAPEPVADASPFLPRLEQRVPMRGRYMPREAMERTITGVAVVCCVPNEDRSLNCEVSWETPVGIGFGEAALRILATQQLTQESYADYMARDERRPFAQAMTFRIDRGPSPPASPSPEERRAICEAAMPIGD